MEKSGTFHTVKSGKETSLLYQGCSYVSQRKSDALGHPAKPPQCIEVMRGFLHVLE